MDCHAHICCLHCCGSQAFIDGQVYTTPNVILKLYYIISTFNKSSVFSFSCARTGKLIVFILKCSLSSKTAQPRAMLYEIKAPSRAVVMQHLQRISPSSVCIYLNNINININNYLFVVLPLKSLIIFSLMFSSW